ncbi:MAG: S1C family serine protease [Dethiobacteria bacterium]|nr:trypsin-like peptidase domain-containing protein [Bacillota bacterium]MDW7729015.1 trypsin-like peptidase domain-containing protein [Bacillota bacterium]
MENHYNKSNSGRGGFWAVIGYLSFGVLGILLGAAMLYGLFIFFLSPSADLAVPEEIIDETEEQVLPEIDIENSLADVAEKTLDAVVGVNKHLNITRFGEQRLEEVESGSGVIIDEEGYIITNQHVIEEADHISVVIPGKGSYEAELIGSDSLTDLALLKIEETGLVALPIGDSDQLRVGEKVLAIGNPFGYFQQTVTAGIISALQRQVRVPGSDYIYPFIQTDALVNPGNSGGPLVNLKGEVIGINTAKIALVGVEGIGLAIPSNTVKRVMSDLYEHGRVIRPHLGVVIDDWLQYGEVEPERGVIIVEVAPGSAADNVGLQAGDIIVAINGEDVYYLALLFDNLFSYYPGDTITVTYYREGVRSEVTVVLGERPENLPAQVEVEEPVEAEEPGAFAEPGDPTENENQENNGE